MNQWMIELEENGVTAELRYGRCDDPTEAVVLPEERDGEIVSRTSLRSALHKNFRLNELGATYSGSSTSYSDLHCTLIKSIVMNNN